jgi:RNA polymerase sigma-70 factor, ECF subfamily
MEFSDEELVAQYRAASGSAAADTLVNQLFHRHHERVAAWCYRVTGDVESSADLAQDILLKAFQRLDSFRGESKFTTWLYSIARNRCMDELRTRAATPKQEAESVMEEIEDMRSLDISDVLEQRESAELAKKLMRESLDPTESKVMTLHYVHELPLDAVTSLLGLTNSSGAKAYVVSGRRKLARAFSQWNIVEQNRKGAGRAE